MQIPVILDFAFDKPCVMTSLFVNGSNTRRSVYHGRYTGDGAGRDGAYHQGTVWPWLMGPFITACMKAEGGSEAARKQAEEWLAPLKEHLADGGLGHISEIFDGDAPHRPVGCIAQAWSVAEILRAAVGDVYGTRPQQSAVPLDAVAQQPGEPKRKRAAG
jgi:glycogen debranching enzyme